jgi:hypothetical protein
MDIELTVDAMELADHLDHIVLFSGDGDFRSLVEALQHKGRRVSVVSTLQTQPAMVADELRRQADQFIDLADLEDDICRDPSIRAQREREQGGPRGYARGPERGPDRGGDRERPSAERGRDRDRGPGTYNQDNDDYADT